MESSLRSLVSCEDHQEYLLRCPFHLIQRQVLLLSPASQPIR